MYLYCVGHPQRPESGYVDGFWHRTFIAGKSVKSVGIVLDFGRMCCFFYYIKISGQDCDIVHAGNRSEKA